MKGMLVGWVAAASMLGAPAPAAGEPPVPRVRAANAAARRLLAFTCGHSATVRGLVDELERADVIVQVLVAPPPRDGLAYHGAVQFLSAAGGYRYVVVWIDSRWNPSRARFSQAALVGHELQHAVEIARAGWVRNQAGMVELFSLIGRRTGLLRFETDEALEVEARVSAELAAAQPGPRGQPGG